MRYRHFLLSGALALTAAGAGQAQAAPDLRARVIPTAGGAFIIPGSSIPGTHGAHTNTQIFLPSDRSAAATGPYGKFETPASLACVYGLTAKTDGCNPETLTNVATTGSKIVAIVDAYDYPTAAADLAVFSKRFGLPAVIAANFAVVYATGKKPQMDPTGGWEVEEALDIDMAHALAPNAKIVLVEAKTNSGNDMLMAERAAAQLVAAAGGGEVSNSWASSETPDEANYEGFFKGDGVVFFAAAGDSPGVAFPAVLPNVVSVGGTTIDRTQSGDYETQTSWSTGGGGISAYLPTPAYQAGVTAIVGQHRGTPDIAMNANVASGVWLYDSTPYNGAAPNWTIVGGTSVASPLAAALTNSSGTFAASTEAELRDIYHELGRPTYFFDIRQGSCANAVSYNVSVGYDLCTGVGAPLALPEK